MRKIKSSSKPPDPELNAPPLRTERRVTSYDVAMLAGVSQSAVSRCFKPGASVSKTTYARVMKAAECLDYIPNAAARSLITRRSNLVAVIISNLANLHYPQALSELSQRIARHGKRVLLFTLEREGDIERTLSDIWQYQIDGVISATRLSDQQLSEFKRRHVPLVMFNRCASGNQVHSVVCDQTDAARQLVSRLAHAGHRQFALIDGPGDSVVAQERKLGALERLLELGLPVPIVVSGNDDYASGGRGLRSIIERLGHTPDAVICGNDLMAIGCLDTARHELGIQVPLHMSVAGFDALEPSSWLSHKLTTLRQPIQKMAQAAADMLAALIDSRDNNLTQAEKRVFYAQLIDGNTARLQHPAKIRELTPEQLGLGVLAA
ncbi:LacI family DNA-binding transcriptional regulator [Janthinobacterium agaricidamnosum]|uniref:Periplasmic binding s and sugar binding domain of the LacI family protein n=1 Tax=Janthinobacterium agaricidamnosum NBRC 102515 = DSM 9628 TaxID=1349767 RepID=W0V7K8_9BURK|nr:LacI family DNA-binding transcriptional regulator [Janthinobacterium agaricidamnosum]CDG83333.1 periplasmic binding s and sugar binding domain of the LacI family protein [Janthinobacterium agaricidamnosum NBRC 102515 = DSM 9628]